MDRNEALGKLADDLRPLLREISEKFIPKKEKKKGWVGILFDLGIGREFVAFAEPVHPSKDVIRLMEQLEYRRYIFGQDTHLFRAAFRKDFKSVTGQVDCGDRDAFPIDRGELNHEANSVLGLAYLCDMYGLKEDALPFALFHWRLTEATQSRQAVYLYFYDVLNRCEGVSPWEKAEGSGFFILYMLHSLLTEFQMIHPHSVWNDLKACLPDDFGFAVSLEAERRRVAMTADRAAFAQQVRSTAIAGHELLNPLNAVLGLVQRLPHTPKVDGVRARIVEKVERMRSLTKFCGEMARVWKRNAHVESPDRGRESTASVLSRSDVCYEDFAEQVTAICRGLCGELEINPDYARKTASLRGNEPSLSDAIPLDFASLADLKPRAISMNGEYLRATLGVLVSNAIAYNREDGDAFARIAFLSRGTPHGLGVFVLVDNAGRLPLTRLKDQVAELNAHDDLEGNIGVGILKVAARVMEYVAPLWEAHEVANGSANGLIRAIAQVAEVKGKGAGDGS